MRTRRQVEKDRNEKADVGRQKSKVERAGMTRSEGEKAGGEK